MMRIFLLSCVILSLAFAGWTIKKTSAFPEQFHGIEQRQVDSNTQAIIDLNARMDRMDHTIEEIQLHAMGAKNGTQDEEIAVLKADDERHEIAIRWAVALSISTLLGIVINILVHTRRQRR